MAERVKRDAEGKSIKDKNMSNMIEDLKQHLRTTPIDRQWEKLIDPNEWEKPRLPANVLEGPLGEMAIEAVGATEPPDDLFVLLSSVLMVGISSKGFSLEGEPFDMNPEPIAFTKPYYAKTMKLVEHLTASGYMRLNSQNARGSMYELVFPQDRGKREEWMQTVINVAAEFFIAERNQEQDKRRQLSRELLEQMPAEQKWRKQYVERMPEKYREAFPQDAPDCLLCDGKDAGIYFGMQRIPDEDPRIPEWAEGTNIVFAFGLCPTCYELPDVESKVLTKIVETDRIV